MHPEQTSSYEFACPGHGWYKIIHVGYLEYRMTGTVQRKRRSTLVGATLALVLSQAGCSAALLGNFLIVLLALAIFVGTIRLGGGDEDGKQPPGR